jgi:hypothetical protein
MVLKLRLLIADDVLTFHLVVNYREVRGLPTVLPNQDAGNHKAPASFKAISIMHTVIITVLTINNEIDSNLCQSYIALLLFPPLFFMAAMTRLITSF